MLRKAQKALNVVKRKFELSSVDKKRDGLTAQTTAFIQGGRTIVDRFKQAQRLNRKYGARRRLVLLSVHNGRGYFERYDDDTDTAWTEPDERDYAAEQSPDFKAFAAGYHKHVSEHGEVPNLGANRTFSPIEPLSSVSEVSTLAQGNVVNSELHAIPSQAIYNDPVLSMGIELGGVVTTLPQHDDMWPDFGSPVAKSNVVERERRIALTLAYNKLSQAHQNGKLSSTAKRRYMDWLETGTHQIRRACRVIWYTQKLPPYPDKLDPNFIHKRPIYPINQPKEKVS
jgi:hypothetical protein